MPLPYPFRLPLLALGWLAAAPALAQTTPADTTHLPYSYTEEVAAPVATTPTPVPHAVVQQWKLGLNNFMLDSRPFYTSQNGYNWTYYMRYGLHVAYERRLGRAWSVQAEVSPALTYTQAPDEATRKAGVGMRAQLAGRYYHNLERRLRLGRLSSPFAANYVAVALGSGLGGSSVRETPFYMYIHDQNRSSGSAADIAALYGLQRRLGRYGFVDVNAGITALLRDGYNPKLDLNASLRVGLALPGASMLPAPNPGTEVTTLLPKFYVGAQASAYYYNVDYSKANPYTDEPSTVHGNESWTKDYKYERIYAQGNYNQELIPLLHLYGGYYFTPRLAAQIGAQYAVYNYTIATTRITAPDGTFEVPSLLGRERELALPVQLRYALIRVLQQRFQLDVLGGLTPLWSSWHMREYGIVNRQITDEVVSEFRRNAFGLHGSLGMAAEYGFGRRRRVQAVAEGMFIQNLKYLSRRNGLTGGVSLGLRYRFGYR